MIILSNEALSLEEIFISLGLKVLKSSDEFVEVMILAKPGAKHEGLEVTDQGELKVSINSAPIEGAANRAIVKLISKKWSISKGAVELLKGEKSSSKRFRVTFSFTNHKNIEYYEGLIKRSLIVKKW